MKKILVASIALLYLSVSSGFAMDVNYCMGRQTGITFFSRINDNCGSCGMKNRKGCCQHKHQFFKLKDVHKTVSNQVIFHAPVINVSTGYSLKTWLLNNKDTGKIIKNHSPPQYSFPSACIMFCVFRI